MARMTTPDIDQSRSDRASRRHKQLEATAYHEAGHAVIYVKCGCRFRYVTIVPKADSLGHLRRFKRTAKNGWVYIHALFCTLAGLLAEKKFTGRTSHVGARSDYYQALDYARMVDETGSGYHENDPLPQALVSGAMKQTERLVIRWWPSIQAVALALLEKETLKESEVINILESDVLMKEQRLLWKELQKREDEERERRMDALEAKLGVGNHAK